MVRNAESLLPPLILSRSHTAKHTKHTKHTKYTKSTKSTRLGLLKDSPALTR
jgi:hypothetical protein